MSLIQPSCVQAYTIDTMKDSDELRVYDSLMVFLADPINQEVNTYYKPFLKEDVIVYDYEIHLLKIDRTESFRGFSFNLLVEVEPVVGPHLSVGRDQLLLSVSPINPEKVKLLSYEHLETYELPSWR